MPTDKKDQLIDLLYQYDPQRGILAQLRLFVQRLSRMEERLKVQEAKQKGDAGQDGLSVDERALENRIFSRIRQPKDGQDADSEAIVQAVLSQIRQPKDGKDAILDEERITKAVLSRIPLPTVMDGKPGKDAVIDEEKIAVSIIKFMRKNKSLTLQDISGLQSFVMNGVKYRVEELMHGGGGSSSSLSFVDNEVVAGSGTSWTLANTPTVSSVQLWGAGIRLTPGAGNDYTIVGAAITTANSYSSGTIIAAYRY